MKIFKKIKEKETKVLERAKKLSWFEKLYYMIAKDFKLILRSKSSALIVILGPLFLILLVGAAFNTANIYGIKIGTYSESYSDLSNSILEELADKQFSIIKIQSQEDCIKSLKSGEIHVCTIFPKDLAIGGEGDILFYVDQSRVNLVYIIIDAISKKVGTKSEELSLQLTKTILDTLDSTNKELSDKEAATAKLITNNQESSTKISVTADTLLDLDLSFNLSETKLASLEKEINDTEVLFNTSLSSLREAFKSVNSNIKKIGSRLTTAKTSRDTIVSDLGIVETSLADDLVSIKDVDSSIKKIRADINNIQVTSAEKIVSPISMKIEPIVAKKTHLSYMFPTLIVLVIMFISILLASTTVIREKVSSSYFRNFITPTKDWLFVAGVFITCIIIVILQLLVIFGIASFFFKGLFTTLFSAAVALILIAAIFILIGMLVGYGFRTEETATLGAISVASLLLFFSNTILPIETLPEIVKNIAAYNPFVIAEFLLKKIILFESNLLLVWISMLILLGYVVVLFAAVYLLRKHSKAHTM